ncbi:MAG: hypothetical protein P9L94_15890 [Candidatus Hinthialibacter antarcticus]|nr:hypothetical protein [Candidatus Hinthialibacter antarcticus]
MTKLHPAKALVVSRRAFGLAVGGAVFSGCNVTIPNPDILTPRDSFLNAPTMIDSRREFGYLGTYSIFVPATTNIFLAGAEDGVVLESPDGHMQDIAPENSPIEALQNIIHGGETLDIYASGVARHIPNRNVEFGPGGWSTQIEAGPERNINAIQAPIGALIGLFNNSRTPFLVGQRRQVVVPRSTRSLYLALMDFPGASSNNQLGYQVSIEVIRR